MKLLFVLPEYPPDHGGGIATFYGALLPALVRQGHEVHALIGSAFVEGQSASEQEGVRVSYLESGRSDRLLASFSRYAATPSLQRYLASARALWEQANGGEGFDRVEVTDWGLLFAPWVGAEGGPPTLVRMHGSSGQIGAHERVQGYEGADQQIRLLEAGLLAHADALHTCSTVNAEYWERMTGRSVAVTPPPLPAAPPVEVSQKREVGFVAGRIQSWKGPHVLAEALRFMGPKAPVVEWAGRATVHPETGHPFDAHLAEAFPDVWGKQLQPLGLIAPSEVARRQAESAFVVVPSLWDVFNLTVAEAMQQGAIVICSDGAGGIDLIEDGVNGFAFAAGDAHGLAGAITSARELSDTQRAAMADNAQKAVAETLDPERIAREVAAHLTALESRAMRPAPWFSEAVSPSSGTAGDSFLDRLPLRLLARHIIRRLRSKVSIS